MRHFQRNTVEDNVRAQAYVGQVVETTDGRYGTVQYAYVRKGVIHLSVLDPTGHDGLFNTTNEYATIRRNS